MQRIDYELGLIANEEDFSGADGKVKAAVCRSQCYGKHPFNKGKRNSCKAGCDAKYRTEIEQEEIVDVAVTQQMGANSTTKAAPTAAPLEVSVVDENQAGMSMGAKIGIGLGAAILIVGGIYMMKKK